MLNVRDGRRRSALADRADALFHVVRRKAVVRPNDADDGNVDGREDVCRRLDDGGNTHQ